MDAGAVKFPAYDLRIGPRGTCTYDFTLEDDAAMLDKSDEVDDIFPV